MSTISHDPAEVGRSERGWRVQLLVPEMWASLAIAVMWLAVLFTSIYGPAIATSASRAHTSARRARRFFIDAMSSPRRRISVIA